MACGDNDISAGMLMSAPTELGHPVYSILGDRLQDSPRAVNAGSLGLRAVVQPLTPSATVDKPLQERASEAALSPSEISALESYTNTAYDVLNSALWSGSISQVSQIATFSHELSSALGKLPDVNQTVLRGSNPLRSISEYDLSRYEPGSVVIENGYLSSTTDPEIEFNGEVLWIIESKRGKSVDHLSSIPSENEVLFDRFSKFEVLSKEYEQDIDRWVIYMTEI